jgi:hypothetical protein
MHARTQSVSVNSGGGWSEPYSGMTVILKAKAALDWLPSKGDALEFAAW